MRERDLFREMSGRLTGLLQSGGEATSDLREKIEQQLREKVADLSAIDREEFDAQVRALARAEERIAALEQTVAALQRRLAGENPDGPAREGAVGEKDAASVQSASDRDPPSGN